MELSGDFPVKLLCEKIGIQRSSFYNWKHSVSDPPERTRNLVKNIVLFQTYHEKYPSHGYRWLNAKIKLDKGLVFSDPYAHKCCKIAGIKSVSKHYKYKKQGDPFKTYPNLLLSGLNIDGPMQCVVSDMTAFYVKGSYYELTLYMDLWNDELIAHSLSAKRGDRMTYINGLQDVIEFKKQFPDQELILHSDQGSVYAFKSYNELLPMYNITRSMSRAGTPTDNAAMESINGWVKTELFTDFHITSNDDVSTQVNEYIRFFNEERPAYTLGYLTPKQYRERFAQKH
ncbi:MAG: IS3 family transposase [Oscillospiraceae bacterium]|nr:IS3 family transposase [Oscillospiraceae bacterium]